MKTTTKSQQEQNISESLTVIEKITAFKNIYGKLPDVLIFNPDDKHLISPIDGVEFRYSRFIDRHSFIAGLKESLDWNYDIANTQLNTPTKDGR